MKAVAIITIILALLFLALAGIVKPIVDKKLPESTASKVISWVSIVLMVLTILGAIVNVIMSAFA